MYQKKVITKKFYFYLIFNLMISAFFFSCTNESNLLKDFGEPFNSEILEQKYGFLSLTLDTNLQQENIENNSREAVSLEDIAALVTNYEILIFNELEVKKLPFLMDETEISVPVGTWGLLILGGTKKDSNSNYLIGSGYCENLIIIENEITAVTVNMYPIDISMKTDKEDFFCNQDVNLEILVNTRNPYLSVKYVYLSGKVNLSCEENCSVSKAIKTITTTPTPGESQIKYSTSSIYFKSGSIEKPLDDFSSFTNIINSSVYEKENMTIKTFNVKKQVITTGMNMLLHWVE